MKHIWLRGTLFALQTPQDSCPCPGVGEATGPVGTAARSAVNGVAASARWSCSCGFTELLKPGWGPQISGQSLAACAGRADTCAEQGCRRALGWEHPTAPVCP